MFHSWRTACMDPRPDPSGAAGTGSGPGAEMKAMSGSEGAELACGEKTYAEPSAQSPPSQADEKAKLLSFHP